MSLFGEKPFDKGEELFLNARLSKRMTKADTKTRVGHGNTKVTYVTSHKAIEITNEIFGFNGWSCQIVKMETHFIEKDESSGKWSCCITAQVKISLRDGTYHEDIGIGSSEGMKSKCAAFENSVKEAVSDARKRCLRVFGNALGNCLYEKEYLVALKSGKAKSYRNDYKGPRLDDEGRLIFLDTAPGTTLEQIATNQAPIQKSISSVDTEAEKKASTKAAVDKQYAAIEKQGLNSENIPVSMPQQNDAIGLKRPLPQDNPISPKSIRAEDDMFDDLDAEMVESFMSRCSGF